jgi:hypothetical protein
MSCCCAACVVYATTYTHIGGSNTATFLNKSETAASSRSQQLQLVQLDNGVTQQ